MRIFLECAEAWACHYFAFQSPMPWLLLEEPISVALEYTILFLPVFFFVRKLASAFEPEVLFWKVISLYGVEFVATAFIALTLVFSITSVMYVVVFVPYIIYAVQSMLLARSLRSAVAIHPVPLVCVFFVLILVSTLLYSSMYRYLVNIYAESLGIF